MSVPSPLICLSTGRKERFADGQIPQKKVSFCNEDEERAFRRHEELKAPISHV